MAYWDTYVVGHGTEFGGRVRIALITEAQSILTNPSPPANQATLVSLVPKFVASEDVLVQLVADVLAIQGLGDATTDAEIQSAVGQVWGLFAGAI